MKRMLFGVAWSQPRSQGLFPGLAREKALGTRLAWFISSCRLSPPKKNDSRKHFRVRRLWGTHLWGSPLRIYRAVFTQCISCATHFLLILADQEHNEVRQTYQMLDWMFFQLFWVPQEEVTTSSQRNRQVGLVVTDPYEDKHNLTHDHFTTNLRVVRIVWPSRRG